jgi:hypoxanthine-guanine phosphoribosyltransferase
VSRVLYSESVISARVKELGAELSVAYAEKRPLVLQARA